MASVYQTLGNNEIRLLVVVHSSKPSDLRFTFSHVPVTKPNPYTAVSYTWNHWAGDERIYIDDRPFLIKRNLWKCLQRLKLSWRFIWADAVCINQTDLEEVNHQVGLMGQIYANAAVVSAWLGGNIQTGGPLEKMLRETQASNASIYHKEGLFRHSQVSW